MKTFEEKKEYIWKDPDWKNFILTNCLEWFEDLKENNKFLSKPFPKNLSFKEFQLINGKNTILHILYNKLFYFISKK